MLARAAKRMMGEESIVVEVAYGISSPGEVSRWETSGVVHDVRWAWFYI